MNKVNGWPKAAQDSNTTDLTKAKYKWLENNRDKNLIPAAQSKAQRAAESPDWGLAGDHLKKVYAVGNS